MGQLDGAPILASETCALDIIGAKYVRDIENGEVIIFDDKGVAQPQAVPADAAAPLHLRIHLFLAAGFHRRRPLGLSKCARPWARELAREAPADADVVVPVPDSGVPAALGYAQASGIPFDLGIIRNHYVGRTFIEPTQQIRELGVRLKHNANRAVVNGKRIVLIDDSIVRGTTSTKIVQMMRDAGAKEVHFRIASPPITHPDYYGIDTPDRDKLLAATHTPGRDARLHRRGLARLPVGRGHLQVDGLREPRSGCARNSPTIASPANIRRRSPTAPSKRTSRGNCRCSQKQADAYSKV